MSENHVLFSLRNRREQLRIEEAARFESERIRKKYMLIAAFISQLVEMGPTLPPRPRRIVPQSPGGWRGSTLIGYINGDEITYKKFFRVTKTTFRHIVTSMNEKGYMLANTCRSAKHRITADFKVAIVLYFLAGHSNGNPQSTADCGSIGKSTVNQYIDEFVDATLNVLKPIYMPSTPPSQEQIDKIRKQFASRRGVPNVAMAVDGYVHVYTDLLQILVITCFLNVFICSSHIPYHPQKSSTAGDYKNWKV